MHLIWQHHPGQDLERPLRPRQPDGLAQRLHMAQQQVAMSRVERDMEIDAGPFLPGAVIARHRFSLPQKG